MPHPRRTTRPRCIPRVLDHSRDAYGSARLGWGPLRKRRFGSSAAHRCRLRMRPCAPPEDAMVTPTEPGRDSHRAILVDLAAPVGAFTYYVAQPRKRSAQNTSPRWCARRPEWAWKATCKRCGSSSNGRAGALPTSRRRPRLWAFRCHAWRDPPTVRQQPIGSCKACAMASSIGKRPVSCSTASRPGCEQSRAPTWRSASTSWSGRLNSPTSGGEETADLTQVAAAAALYEPTASTALRRSSTSRCV